MPYQDVFILYCRLVLILMYIQNCKKKNFHISWKANSISFSITTFFILSSDNAFLVIHIQLILTNVKEKEETWSEEVKNVKKDSSYQTYIPYSRPTLIQIVLSGNNTIHVVSHSTAYLHIYSSSSSSSSEYQKQ